MMKTTKMIVVLLFVLISSRSSDSLPVQTIPRSNGILNSTTDQNVSRMECPESGLQEKRLELNDQQVVMCIIGAPFIASSETMGFPSYEVIELVGLGICPKVVDCKNQPDDTQSVVIITLSPFIMIANILRFEFPFGIKC